MAVDAFVMPLWRFKVGDFTTAVERLGGTTLQITNAGAVQQKRRRAPGFFARRRAKQEVRKICGEVGLVNEMIVNWHDDGSVVYSEQFHGGDSIRCFLWWFDRQDILEFRDLYQGRDESGRFWKTAPARVPSFPHLARNGYYNDYFLPVRFPNRVTVEPYKIAGWYDAAKSASSTQQALDELKAISERFDLPNGYRWTEGDPFAGPRAAFDQLRTILELSDQHCLPVIFY